ncbi:uncharacterized protein LOC122920960 isoform X2 [Bufo gargarizans]|uniref:uncharacterized protein LOC122920960 isoform X2 n=1 Tax=Bufo gargarizans TaxID=30331 RepID=UPI001CF15841|nr:uncharacterized protein LOC122920960 isoform X2 [Bufo gargarizans]
MFFIFIQFYLYFNRDFIKMCAAEENMMPVDIIVWILFRVRSLPAMLVLKPGVKLTHMGTLQIQRQMGYDQETVKNRLVEIRLACRLGQVQLWNVFYSACPLPASAAGCTISSASTVLMKSGEDHESRMSVGPTMLGDKCLINGGLAAGAPIITREGAPAHHWNTHVCPPLHSTLWDCWGQPSTSPVRLSLGTTAACQNFII